MSRCNPYDLQHRQAFSGNVDLDNNARENNGSDTLDRDLETQYSEHTLEGDPSGEGVLSESTVETELYGQPRRIEGADMSYHDFDSTGRTRVTARSIVVTIPKSRLAEIQAEEADVAQRQSAGETGINYYWQMGRLPAEVPSRIYFLWDGAVRAFHEVTGIDRNAGRLYMDTAIHSMPAPMPMSGFRGFRYMKDEPAGRVDKSGLFNRITVTADDSVRNLDDLTLNDHADPSPLQSNRADAYHGDNFAEDQDLHLGAGVEVSGESVFDSEIDESSPTNPKFMGTTPSDGFWQYAPDMQTNPIVSQDDVGRVEYESDKRSPFVKVFRRSVRRQPRDRG